MTTTRGPVVVAVVAGEFLLAGCAAGTSTRYLTPTPTPSSTYTPAELVVIYELESDDVTSADITYQTPTGSSQQEGVDVPLTMEKSGEQGMELTGFSPGDFVYLSAQISSEYGGSLTCRISE
jgi:hypothetical protein